MSDAKPSDDGCLLRGCLFFVVVILVLVGFAFASAYSTYRNLYDLTSDKPIAVPIADAGSYAATKAKLDAFTTENANGKAKTISLSASDLNALVAGEPAFAPARGKLFFTIRDSKVIVQVSVPLDGLRWMKGRWLNGSVTIAPRMEGGQLVLLPKAIESGPHSASLGTVWAVQQIAWSTQQITQSLGESGDFGFWHGVKSIRVEKDQLILSTE